MLLGRMVLVRAVLVLLSATGATQSQFSLFSVPTSDETFGRTISAVGDDKVLIGIYLFDMEGNLLTTFNDPEPAVGRWYGMNVSAIGPDKVLVGASSYSTDVPGAAFLFDLEGNLLRTYYGPPASSIGFDGARGIGLDNVFALVSSEPLSVRKVQLFDLDAHLLSTFQDPFGPPAYFDQNTGFGALVAAVGREKVVITSPYSMGFRLPVYLFDLQGNLLSTLRLPRGLNNTFMPIALVGENRLVVGGPDYLLLGDPVTRSGHVFIFDLQSGTSPVTLSSPTPIAYGQFGYGVAAVGADRLVVSEGSSGAAYLFDLQGRLLTIYSGPSGGWLGGAVAAAGPDRFLVQGPGESVSLIKLQANANAPAMVCQPDFTVTCLRDVPPPDFTGTVSDSSDPNPQVTLVKEQTQWTSIPVSARISRIFRATNASGLSQTCTQTIFFQPVPGDLNGNCTFDRNDLDLLLAGIRERSSNPSYDVNGDGKVDIADARYLVLHLTTH